MKYPEDYINKIICGDCLEVKGGRMLIIKSYQYKRELRTDYLIFGFILLLRKTKLC